MFSLQSALAIYSGGFGAFFAEYWWMFLALAVSIGLLVFVIVWAAKRSSNAEEKPQENKDFDFPPIYNEQKAEEKPTKETTKKEVKKSAPKATVKKQTKTVKKEKEEKPAAKKAAPKAKPVAKAEPKTTVKAEKKPEKKTPVKKVTEKKPAEKEEEANDEVKAAGKYVVKYDKDAQNWIVKVNGSKKASKRCATKAEAMKIAKELADKKKVTLSVRKMNGQFQKQK